MARSALSLCILPLLKVAGLVAVDDAPSGTGGSHAGRWMSARWWVDPPVFLALWLYVTILGQNTASLLSFSDLAGAFGSAGDASSTQLLTDDLPLVVVAVFGVGTFIRRTPRETIARLGYGLPTLRQLAIIPPFVAATLALSFASSSVLELLQPELAREVGGVLQNLFRPEGSSLAAALLLALIIGFGAAASEETLFRGAVQPVLGIPLTSLLFASMHVQYGLSVFLVHVFLLSVGLGLLRKHADTSTAFLAHAGYSFSAVLLPYLAGD